MGRTTVSGMLRGAAAALAATALIAGIITVRAHGETQRGPTAGDRPSGERAFLLQIGPHALAAYNAEEPLIDLSKAWGGNWRAELRNGDILSETELRAQGFIDPETGMPVGEPENFKNYIGPRILAPARSFPDFYAGAYAMEWEGSAYGFLGGQPRDLETRIGARKLTFAVRFDSASGRGVGFSRIRGDGLKSFQIYRSKYKKRLRDGEVWSPVHVDNMRNYDVIRTMDYQATNGTPVRSFADVAKPTDPGWGRFLGLGWPASGRFGAPYEILVDLAMRAEARLWLVAPPMIGSPFHLADPRFRFDDNPDRVDPEKIRAAAKAAGAEILASAEWEAFAGEAIDRLVEGGYPADRPLYLEVGNEVWNTAGNFALHTHYAGGIGQSIRDDWNVREGYGALSARWASAFERALEERGRDQDVVYVLAGQTAWAGTTQLALTGYEHQLKAMDLRRDAFFAKTGVAITNYHSCTNTFAEKQFGPLDAPGTRRAFEAAIRDDGEALMRALHDYCLNARAGAHSLHWVLSKWREHATIAKNAGVDFIGAYEGGSHDMLASDLAASPTIRSWWTDFHWGPLGADVVRQINLSLIEAFPGVMLSNYTGMGDIGGHPWDDGHYSKDTAMLQMWREFYRPRSQEAE
ncbi:MAG: hypothetical protein AAFW81_02055 [Pseudomonadota bacterium]